jgi:hypothetical protein
MKNESHDLRLLHIVYKKLKNITTAKPIRQTYIELFSILKKVKYGMGIKEEREKKYGTKENLKIESKGDWVYNVHHAFTLLKKAVLNPDVIRENNSRYNDKTNELGILHIYDDGRPMRYEK